MKLLIIVCLSITLNMVLIYVPASGQPICPDCPKWQRDAPYGDYCPGSRWGWYGARKRVLTLEEAKTILTKYFSDKYGDIKVVNIHEGKRFFMAEIMDKDDSLIDVVILDKRTGRIRSIY